MKAMEKSYRNNNLKVISIKRNYATFRKFDILAVPEEVAKHLVKKDVAEIVNTHD